MSKTLDWWYDFFFMANFTRWSLTTAAIESMEKRPGDFTVDEKDIVLTDKETRTEYWIGAGLGFYGINGERVQVFGLVNAIRFHSALNQWRKDKRRKK